MRLRPHVLAIDNDQLVLTTLELLFTREGFDFKLASHKERGIELLREHAESITVALIDYALEQSQGDRLISLLREIKPELPILVFSGHSQKEIQERCLQAGANHYFVKGDDITEMVKLIRASGAT